MGNSNLESFLCGSRDSLVRAMEKINQNAKGIVYVTDEVGHLIGSLSDGDIRSQLVHHKINN